MTLPRPATNPLDIRLVTSRRRFLAGGGLVLGFSLLPASSHGQRVNEPSGGQPVSNDEIAVASGEGFDGFSPDAFIRITPKGDIFLIIPNVEMGQGVYTGEAMLIAEELEVALDQVRIVPAPPNEDLYKQPLLQFQGTGGSTSIRGTWEPLRRAGATARTMLVEAAARRWKVDSASCRAEQGRVLHEGTGRSAAYGELVRDAARAPVPKDVSLKDPAAFRLIGKPAPRVDSSSKADGSARYGIDIMMPGMKFAAVMSCPVLGGTLREVDDSAARKVAGVVQVVRLPDAVAVVGDHYWAAHSGLKALRLSWNPGPNAGMTTRGLLSDIEKASRSGQAAVAVERGNVAQAMEGARTKVEAVYVQPFLCHAPMEPQAAVVHAADGGARVWCGTQVPSLAQMAAAKALGVKPGRVTLFNQYIGGAFGRKLETDYVAQAAAIGRECPFPVKMVWSREQDTKHDNYRPMYVDRISAGLDEQGLPVAWNHRITGASVTARYAPAGMRPNGVDPDAVEEAEDPVYGQFANMRVDFVQWQPPPGLVVSWWRGVGPTHSVFVVESFVDELAHATGRDPFEYRRALLANQPRARAVLERAAKAADWGSKLPGRTGRGIIVQKSFGSFIAVVLEAAVSEEGDVTLRRITAAVDCGIAVNPNLVKQQVEGGILFGLSAALYNEITFEGGEVQQSNFHDYRSLRLNETPPIEVIHVATSHPPGGIGETGTTAAAPVLMNAIFAATGVRLRELPVRRELLRGKKA